MKTKAKYVIVILFLCTIPLYFCRMIGWKDDAIRRKVSLKISTHG